MNRLSTKTGLTVRSAFEDERSAALRLVFQHLSEKEQTAKLGIAQDMISRGELDPGGIWVVVDGTGMAGAMIVATSPGPVGIVWPPRVRVSLVDAIPVQDALIVGATNWLQSRNVRLAQTLLLPEEMQAADSLLRNGFQHITRLIYLRHFLDLSAEELAIPERLAFRTAADVAPGLLESVVSRTYEGSLDCPELNVCRTPAEFVLGHRNASSHDPKQWWIAFHNDEPAGVILLNASEPEIWDIAYLAVVPEQRHRGMGRELVRKSLFEAKAAEMLTVTLAVDERNEPARRLYRSAGFESFDEREVLLFDLNERRRKPPSNAVIA